MPARRFLVWVHGLLMERLDEDGRAVLEEAMADPGVRAARRREQIDQVVAAFGGDVAT